MQRLRILHRTNASRFFMTDVKPSLTRLEEELKNQERLFSQKRTLKELTFREHRFPCNVKGPVDRTWFCDGTFYGFYCFSLVMRSYRSYHSLRSLEVKANCFFAEYSAIKHMALTSLISLTSHSWKGR